MQGDVNMPSRKFRDGDPKVNFFREEGHSGIKQFSSTASILLSQDSKVESFVLSSLLATRSCILCLQSQIASALDRAQTAFTNAFYTG